MPNFQGKKPNFQSNKPNFQGKRQQESKSMPNFQTKPNFTGGNPPVPSFGAKPAKPVIEIDKPKPPRLISHPEPNKDFRPNVDMVVACVRNYLRAMAPTAMPDPNSDRWEERARQNKEELEKQLVQIGLKDAINWDG